MSNEGSQMPIQSNSEWAKGVWYHSDPSVLLVHFLLSQEIFKLELLT